MNIEKQIRKYKFKVFLNAIVNSLVYGLINGFMITSIIALILFFFKVNKLFIILIIFGILFIGTTIYAYFKLFRVSNEEIARKLDELDLNERIITMLEYQTDEKEIYQLQREDALDKLKLVNPKQLKINIKKYTIIILLVTMFIFSASFFLPSPKTSSANPINPGDIIEEPSEEDKIIKEMLEKIRKIIDDSGLEPELKRRLHEYVDNLELSLKNCTTTAAKVNLIKKAMKEIEEIIDYYLTERYLGQALQMVEKINSSGILTNRDFETQELGLAISEKDLEGVDSSLEKFKQELLASTKAKSTRFDEIKNQYAADLEEALKRGTLEENEALVTAVSNFKNNLDTATPENIVDVIEQAKEEIKKALMEDPSGTQEDQAAEDADQAKEDISDAMQDALDQLEQEEQQPEEEDQISQDGEGEEESDENPPVVKPENPVDSEPIIDGNTPYLPEYEEYADIIKQILASYEGQDIPEDVKKMIEEYLKMLN